MLIVAGAVAMLGYIWTAFEGHRQDNVMRTALTLIATALLLIVWMLFFSRLRFRHRLLLLAIPVVACIAMASLFTVRGVSGDMVPVLGWRFAKAPAEQGAPGLDGEATLAPGESLGAGYPQYLGPSRDATLAGPRLARDWDTQPPQLLWRQGVGDGWSGFAVSGRYAVTQDQREGTERVLAVDLLSGASLWVHEDAVRHDDPLGGIGPRATPSIIAGKVVTQGATGLLNVLDLQTGQRLWSTNVLDDAGAPRPEYGVSTSPLVIEKATGEAMDAEQPDGDPGHSGHHVVVFSGGGGGTLLAAYELETGQILWQSGKDSGSYSSPALYTLGGIQQILILGTQWLSAYDPATGDLLWEFEWETGPPRAAQPVAIPGDRILISSGYGMGSKLLQIDADGEGAWSVNLLWESRALKAKFANVVHREGILYGLDDGILVAVDVETGKRIWKRGRYGHGQLILVDDVLLIQTEKGPAALVEATPDEFRELARLDVLGSKTWNNPALAGPYFLVRNDREAACYRLPLLP